jgi:uncharacterized protein YvpB
MRSEKSRKKISWSTWFGTIFALIICMTASGMIYIIYPQSVQFLKLLFGLNESNVSIPVSIQSISNRPTPFQPMATYTAQTIPTIVSTPVPTDTPVPTPTPQPTPIKYIDIVNPPEYASINGLYGSPQIYTLDCEAQAAVDWARFFGVKINHMEFIDRLPKSDDPEEGFVGNINGPMGHLPPGDYGVHAGPVAALLREYGLNAKAVIGWSLVDLKKEIASGRPVIVWTVNLPFAVETSEYTASNGKTTTVARYEHTWIITGYNAHVFTVVDSEWTYNVKYSTLIERWGALGNQAIIYQSD